MSDALETLYAMHLIFTINGAKKKARQIMKDIQALKRDMENK